MIRKSGHRLSEQIMLKQKDRARWRFNEKRSRFGCADQGDPRRGRQMTSEHLDWDNLRYFLAVARAGKLTAAARRLGQDHTTVGRRIASLESAFRSKLFERRPEGYRLTETGQRLYENVKTLESSVWEIQRDLAGQTQQVEGVVRIGAPD